MSSPGVAERLEEVVLPRNAGRTALIQIGPLAGKPASNGLRSAKRLPELDGLRALAILPVIFSHCYPREGWWRWTSFAGETGWMGVDLFFVLSGYFITGILLDTVETKYYFRNFIIRRTLRILPLYYLCLALFTVATRLDHSQWEALRTWGGVGWFFACVGNIRLAWTGTMPPVFSFDPLWSLQVEEQFYLLYPVMVFCLSRPRLCRLLIACVAAAPVLRCFLFFLQGSGAARYVLMPCRMDALALGGLVALLVRSPVAGTLKFNKVRSGALLSGAAAVLCAAISPGSFSPLMSSIGYTIIDLTSALVLIMVVLWPSNTPGKWLRSRPLAYTGRIAYGLYLLHGPASWISRTVIERISRIHIDGHSALSVPVTFVSAFIAAGISWRFLESPALALKDRLTRSDDKALSFVASQSR